MNIKKPLLRWSVAVLAVLTLTACGSTTSSPTTTPSSPASVDSTTSAPTTGNPAVQKAQTGQVTFNVQFPQAALKKALMDDRTASISVVWQTYNPFASGTALLTPDPVTHIATATLDVPVGTAYFSAIAMDNSGAELDMTSTAGEITAGSNTVYLTFLGGDWQFVDAGDNPLPQSFSDGTTITTLAGFNLTSSQVYAGPTKASVDLGKPSSWSEYQLQWHNSTPAAIGPVMWAGQGAQFNAPTATGSSFGSDSLNITDPARSDTDNGISLDPVPGDRLLWIMSWVDDNGPTTITDAANNDLIPGFRTAGDSQVLDGNHIVGHLMAMTFESYTEANITPNVDCQAFWFAQQVTPAAARAAAIKASLSKAAGKAAVGDETTLTAGTATVNYSECDEDYAALFDGDGDGDKSWESLTYDANGNGRYDAGDSFYDNDLDGHWDYTYYPGTSYDVTEQFSNIVAREFRAKGSQAGSVFTPPAIQASAVGTWMAIEPGTNKVIIMAFPDSSNYLLGEDGIADGFGGMPGVEVGTYNLNPAAAEATFNVTYETNGNWGPATVGVPSTMSISELTDTTLTVVVPEDMSTFSFDRVMPDPTNPIVGSWYFTGTGMGSTILVLLNDNKYYAVQVDAADANNRFFESGTYTWDGFTITGTFAGTGVFSTSTGNSAIAAPGATNTLMINISGNTLTLSDVDGSYTATRL